MKGYTFISQFNHKNNSFRAESGMVDTYYGPENKVEFTKWNGETWELVKTYSECMGDKDIIEMFKDYINSFSEG